MASEKLTRVTFKREPKQVKRNRNRRRGVETFSKVGEMGSMYGVYRNGRGRKEMDEGYLR